MDEAEKEYKKMSERISESREAMQVNVSFVTNTSWVFLVCFSNSTKCAT